MERVRTPRDDVFDVLSHFFGGPRTKTERTMYGKVVAELMEAGATPEETTKACEYVLLKFDKPSPFAVVKWFAVSLNEKPRLSSSAASIQQLRSL